MNNELKKITSDEVKMYAATAMAQSLSFCLERKYLDSIDDENVNPLFKLQDIDTTSKTDVSWVEISQIGKPVKNDAESCFTAIQKILYSCFMPQETQLLFLIVKNGGVNKMYLGIRPLNFNVKKNITRYLSDFMKGTWPGLQCRVVKDAENDPTIKDFVSDIEREKLEYIYALTGIPSMESQYKTIYPATIDKLMAGMNQSKDFAYFVVANPIDSNEVDEMLYQCREMNGQAESLKSMNITKGTSKGQSETNTDTFGTQQSVTDGASQTERKLNKLGKVVTFGAAGLGVSAAASFFPAASAVVESTMASAAAGVMGAVGLGSLLPMFMKEKQISHSETSVTSESHSRALSFSISNTESISHNVVNKHIESISEHLFYHSKRLETGKAIGMWKVGAYLLTSRESDAKGASMQLRSILSGQESIFEPIRVTDISMVVNPSKSFGQLQAPIIRIDNISNARPFEHPLGDSYKELKTVLTTKELSYFINFPLRSVPGISVVDSVPEFSLNQPVVVDDEPSIDFGKLLYGGSETAISYRLPINTLAKHTLLSGINGTGKTNTVKAVLNAMNESEAKIPFLVIEPAKTEYVDWAIEYNKEHKDHHIKIFIPGCKTYRDRKTRQEVELSALKLNPFEPVWLAQEQDPNILTHIDRLKSTFASAFPMYDILPVLLEDLIYTLYQSPSTNWIGKNAAPVFGKTLAPTLTNMAGHVDQTIEAHGYEKRVSDNMMACLNTRIASLRRGWKKDMLDTLHSTSWSELFGQPCVVNLSYVGDDVDKSFFMSLILQYLYEYRTAQAECGQIDLDSNICRHLTVIEEAHRVMQKCDKPEESQYKTAMMFSNMLSEIRAYGEGMFLVDQVPTRLIPDAIKNTNTKITHRLVAEDDCKAIAESMGITKEQRPIIPKLLVGQCLISTALSTDKHWIKVSKA